jgi:glycosyltransferase involved in cell wall biosynthesis
LRELAKRHRITLFTFYAAHANDMHAELRKTFEKVVCLPLDVPARRSPREYLNFFRQLLSPIPYSIAKYCRPEVARALRELFAAEQFDVVVCDFILPAILIPWEISCPKVVFTHNAETLIWKRHLEVAESTLWKLVTWREYRTMAAYEKRYLAKADAILTVSEPDRKFFNNLLVKSDISVIPTGVDIDYFAPLPRQERSNSLVFCGSMDWIPNEEGILFFMEQVLPTIRQQLPDVTLKIVGRNPSEKLRRIARAYSAEVTGTVNDVRPHVGEAAVYVVPLRVGSGTRLKIFEAMAMGKAIVSTTLGAEGLPVSDGVNIILADDPNYFAQKVTGLLLDPEERTRLGQAGRQLVSQHYSWAAVSGAIDEVLLRVAGREGSRSVIDRKNKALDMARP